MKIALFSIKIWQPDKNKNTATKKTSMKRGIVKLNRNESELQFWLRGLAKLGPNLGTNWVAFLMSLEVCHFFGPKSTIIFEQLFAIQVSLIAGLFGGNKVVNFFFCFWKFWIYELIIRLWHSTIWRVCFVFCNYCWKKVTLIDSWGFHPIISCFFWADLQQIWRFSRQWVWPAIQ